MRQNGCVQVSDSEELRRRAVEVQVLSVGILDVKKPGEVVNVVGRGLGKLSNKEKERCGLWSFRSEGR